MKRKHWRTRAIENTRKKGKEEKKKKEKRKQKKKKEERKKKKRKRKRRKKTGRKLFQENLVYDAPEAALNSFAEGRF